MFKSISVVSRRTGHARSALSLTHAKSFSTANELLVDHIYDTEQAFKLTKAFSTKSYDESIMLSLNLGVDPRKPNQMVRGMAPVPHGAGKKVVLAVFASGEKANEAEKAGADIVGGEELVAQIQSGKIEFNRCIATPDMMRHLAKVARVLGPRGLMPNPKLGTVTNDIFDAVTSSKKGQISYRCDKVGIIHCAIGKASWPLPKLIENYNAFVTAIFHAKPSGAKGTYFRSAFLGTHGMGTKLNVKQYPFKPSN